MATTQTFKVSKKDFPTFEVTAQLPENLEDPRWEQIVNKADEDVNDLALRAWIVQCQAGARSRLDESASDEQNAAAVQQFVDEYVYGARTGGFQRPTVTQEKAAELGFSEEQLAALRSIGVNVAA